MATRADPAVASVLAAVERFYADLERRQAAATRLLSAAFDDALKVARVDLLAAAAAAAANPTDPGRAFTEARARALVSSIEAAYRDAAGQAAAPLTDAVRDATLLGVTSADAAAGLYAGWVTASPAAVAAITATTAPGAPVAQLLARLGPDAADAAIVALRRGVALGYNPRKTARLMLAAADTLGRHRAVTIARTETLRAFRAARLHAYQQQRDVIGGWAWIAKLDRRTCAACWAMHGTVHPPDEPMAAHPNCRCRDIPLPDLAPDELAQYLSAVPDAPAAFRRLSAADQRAVLGPARLRLYQDGSLDLRDVVGYADSPVWGRSVTVRPLTAAQRRAAWRDRRVAR